MAVRFRQVVVDQDGNLLLIGKEEALQERQEKEQALQEKERAQQQQQQLTEKLRSLSIEQLNALGITSVDLD